MILTPNAKINIGLDVVRKRADGYHDIETLFVPAPGLRDVLEVVKADEPKLTTYGIPCDVPMEKNLCFRAFRLIQKLYGIGNVNIFLYKNIPMGAGLGGGSSDAAFTLIALNEIFELGLGQDRLAALAAELGSDCPFFIYNRPMFASGRGEILEPYELDLSHYRIEIVTPGLHISTPEAYAGVDAIKGLDVSTPLDMTPQTPLEMTHGVPLDMTPRSSLDVTQGVPLDMTPRVPLDMTPRSSLDMTPRSSLDMTTGGVSFRPNEVSGEISCSPQTTKPLKDRLACGIINWRENVVNDFEAYAFSKYPILADIKNELYDKGAIYASMTGSGSALYGIFYK